MGLKEIIENNPIIIFSTIAIASFGTGYKVAQSILKRKKDYEINNLIKNISTKIILLDTETLRERIRRIEGALSKFAFIEEKSRNETNDLTSVIEGKPDILIAHWHTYYSKGDGTNYTHSEKKLAKKIEEFYNENKNIEVIIFSTDFDKEKHKEECSNQFSKNIKVTLLPLGNDSETELKEIIDKVLSISIKKIKKSPLSSTH